MQVKVAYKLKCHMTHISKYYRNQVLPTSHQEFELDFRGADQHGKIQYQATAYNFIKGIILSKCLGKGRGRREIELLTTSRTSDNIRLNQNFISFL